MAKRKSESVCLHGYFMKKEAKEDEDGSDQSDGSDDDEWLDYEDISAMAGSSYIRSHSIKREVVHFKDEKRGMMRVNGCFPMQDPWWAASLTVSKPRGNGNYCYLKGAPSYKVRTDDNVAAEGIVSMLLTACEVPDDHKTQFFNTVGSWGESGNITILELSSMLDNFSSSSAENGNIAKAIKTFLKKGPAGMVFQCLENGDIFTYLPQLFPRKFQALAAKLQDKPNKVATLQHILDNEPWALGFSNVMTYKHNWFGLEARVQNLVDSGLFEAINPVEQDALFIYDVMKTMCRRYGHTFIYAKSLHQSKLFGEYQVRNWRDALAFLEKHYVIVMEKEEDHSKDDFARIFLRKLWKAENSIAESFASLFEKHVLDPWEIEIDFDSGEFTDLLNDQDQKTAAELIACKPVVCLSGKGGCGKTHVVSKVFRYAEALLKRQKEIEFQEDMFNQSGLDDLALTKNVDDFERTHLSQGDASTLDILRNLEDSQAHTVFDCSQQKRNIQNDSLTSANERNQTFEESFTSEILLSQSFYRNTPGGSRYVSDLEMEMYHSPSKSKSSASSSKEKDEDVEPLILLSAPTGKAANLLGRRSHLSSSTLHQVIFNYRAWKNSGLDDKGKQKPWKYGKVQALVVDECSLVSVSTFSTLLNMLVNDAQLRKIVLLGDVNQLPSIEPGNFLADAFASLGAVGCSHTLRTNHRSESQLIIDNATRISQQQAPIIDPMRNFEQFTIDVKPLHGQKLDDFGIEQDQVVRHILKENAAMKDHTTSQFVAFRRKDCDQINEKCCKHYSNHVTQDEKGHRLFQVGDKVCCTKNTLTKDHLSGKQVRLCNGEIFFITEDTEVSEGGSSQGNKTRYLTLEDKENPAVKIPYSVLRRNCKLKHSWARTIHTYQGSESDTVAYVVGSGRGQTWQHVYTAVTRGRKHVIMLAREEDLDEAIARPPGHRNTMLKSRIQDALRQGKHDKRRPQGFQSASTLCKSSDLNLRQTNSSLSPQHHQASVQYSQVCPSQQESTCISSLQSHDTQDLHDDCTKFVTNADDSFYKDTEGDSQNFSDWGDSMLEEVTQTESLQSNPCICDKENPICTCSANKHMSCNRIFNESASSSTSDKSNSSLFLTQSFSHDPSLWRHGHVIESPERDHSLFSPFTTPNKDLNSPTSTTPKRHLEDLEVRTRKFRRALDVGIVTSSDISPTRRRLDASLSLVEKD